MKCFAMAATLCCVLSVSAFAGDIPSVPVAPPPPDGTTSPTVPGEIPTGGLAQQMAETALDLVQLVLSAVV